MWEVDSTSEIYELNEDYNTLSTEETFSETDKIFFTAGLPERGPRVTEVGGKFLIDQMYTPIPQWHRVAIIFCIYVIGCIVNSLVLRIYWRSESSNRLYVLAMALHDLFCLHFVLVPPIFRMFAPTDHIRDVILIVRVTSGFVYFNTYLIAPLYLAIDRFVAVMFPHKVHIILPKLRPIKIVVVPALVLAVLASVFADYQANPDSYWAIVIQFILTFVLSLEIAGIVGLYIAIAIQLAYKSAKIDQSKQTR